MESGSEDLASFFKSRTKDRKVLSDNLVRYYWEFMLEAVQALHREGGLYSKTCLKRSLKRRQKIGFQDRLSLNAGQMYCRML